MRLLRLVVLKCIKEERSCLLYHVLRHEDVNNTFNINKGSVLIVHKLCRKFSTLLWIRLHDVLQQSHVVRLEADLL